MCIIIDVNRLRDFMDAKNADMQPVRDWVQRGGVIVYYSKGKFKKEWQALPKVTGKLFVEYSRSGNLVDADSEKVSEAKKYLQNKKLTSNDKHILKVAMAENVEVLVTQDGKLMKDFTDKRIMGWKGKIYQNLKHKHLLSKKLCKRLRKGNK